VIVDIREAGAGAIADYARVPIAFEVRDIFDCIDDSTAPGGVALSARRLETSYIKNYDDFAPEHPTQWSTRFAGNRWTLFLAYVDGALGGGAVVVLDTARPEQSEHVILWDIRVSPHVRRAGVGTALFRRAEEWMVLHGCRALEVETQSVNVPACRFYERQGCFLRAANRGAYPEFPDEVQLIWRKTL
jgi:ribosomal protein S18 acetylase RimI-like enzyme